MVNLIFFFAYISIEQLVARREKVFLANYSCPRAISVVDLHQFKTWRGFHLLHVIVVIFGPRVGARPTVLGENGAKHPDRYGT